MGSVWNSLPQGKRSCSGEFFRGVYDPWFLSHHNKDLEWWTLKPPRHVTALGSWTDCVIAHRVIALRQISVTALFYLEDSRRIRPRNVRACRPKDVKRREWRSTPARRREREKERERESKRESERERGNPLAPLFICFSLPLGLPYANWANPECCLFYLKSSLRSSDCPLTFLCSIFMGFSLPCLLATAHFGLLFPILTT